MVVEQLGSMVHVSYRDMTYRDCPNTSQGPFGFKFAVDTPWINAFAMWV